MNILECLETESFNELINFSFEEVRDVFNLNPYFVSIQEGNQFIAEATEVKCWYTEELRKIEEYTSGEYTDKVNLEIEIPEFEEPNYKINGVEVQTKRKLIKLISKYFNKSCFDFNKKAIYGKVSFKEKAVETPHEMLVALNVNKNSIYALLTIIGYYQRHYGYFLSKADFLKICNDYSNQAYFINKNLGMKYRFVNIFLGSSRLKPSKVKQNNDTDFTVQQHIPEHYQNKKFIDVDKISLLLLVQPYLKNNTQEIHKIIEIMAKNFKRHDEQTWNRTWNEVAEFIKECEIKGIMKRL